MPAARGWPLAYALAWISVAGGNSVMPPWVRHQFPQGGQCVKHLRDTACARPRLRLVPRAATMPRQVLHRWFGIDRNFAPSPGR